MNPIEPPQHPRLWRPADDRVDYDDDTDRSSRSYSPSSSEEGELTEDETQSAVEERDAGYAPPRCVTPPPTSSDVTRLVVDYLISEGHREAAELLCRESGQQLDDSQMELLEARVEIRDAILHGQIKEAIDKVTSLCPSLLEQNSEVRFHLMQQQLIEIIRGGDLAAALAFAQENLSTEAKLNESQLSRLERTFALLAFERPDESPFAELLADGHRQMVSTEVNAAVLSSQGLPSSSRLEGLFRMMVWSQQQLSPHDPLSRDSVTVARQLFASRDRDDSTTC